MSDADPVISVDYTDLFRHRSRQFTIGDDVRVAGGIDGLGFAWGAGVGVAVGLLTGITFGVIDIAWMTWWLGTGIFAAVAFAALHYIRRGGSGWRARLTVMASTVLALASLSWLPWWAGPIIGLLVTITLYTFVSRDSRGRISPIERIFLLIDYAFRQPSRIHGMGSDDSPTHLHWQALLYRPAWMPESTTTFEPPAQYGIVKGR